MKKILLFPLLDSMPSGHHQVADAIRDCVADHTDEIECKKMDLLSEWSPKIESATVKTYLKWVRHAPASYAWIYRQLAYKSKDDRSYKYYEWLFKNKIENIIKEEKPDLIVCTHGFPSFFINKLKETGDCPAPCLNIYTDFFINDVWGRSHIDYHFVPTQQMKTELQTESDIPGQNILVTGIPTSRKFDEQIEKNSGNRLNVLISGGSAGLGNMLEMLEAVPRNSSMNVQVLCGTNETLYENMKNLDNDSVQPLPYISSKREMNRLYSTADALITKPGGVTVSEALKKKLPIFIHSVLPGQEEINLHYLTEQKLVFVIPENEEPLDFVRKTLRDDEKIRAYRMAVENYRQSLDLKSDDEIFGFIDGVLAEN